MIFRGKQQSTATEKKYTHSTGDMERKEKDKGKEKSEALHPTPPQIQSERSASLWFTQAHTSPTNNRNNSNNPNNPNSTSEKGGSQANDSPFPVMQIIGL